MATSTKDTTPPVAPFVLTNGSFASLVAPQVTMVTTVGSVVLELDAYNAPISTANLLAYVNDGFYSGALFHRVIPGFVAQTGGYTTGLAYKTPTYDPIVLESTNLLSNLRGTLGMARTDVYNSATSQFYVNLADNKFLDYASPAKPGYAVFGKVVSGMDVIDAMATQPTVTVATATVGRLENVPQTEISISSATETQQGKSISKTGVVSVGALETGARWEYSINKGVTWKKGTGKTFTLAEGSYAANLIQVRQTDAAGNVSTHNGQSEVIMVVDKTAPKAISFNPGLGSVGFPVAQSLSITFNEIIKSGTGTVTLTTAAGKVVQSWQITPGSGSAASATIDPTDDLAYGTTYFLEMSSGAITDLAGNAYAGLKKFKFTTTPTVSTAAAAYTLVNEANNLTYVGTADFSGTGNDNNNILTGGAANDSLWGKGGKDILLGGAGADTLYGENGSDTLTGGDGSDYFVLSSPTHTGVDLFIDFKPGEDKIAFISANFTGLPTALTAADWLTGAGKKVASSGQHLIYDTRSGELYYDADGLAATPAVKIAIIGKTTHPTLSLGDFLMG
jgi:cyclophilin family peptidyl-prolyl cis-trans isomerase